MAGALDSLIIPMVVRQDKTRSSVIHWISRNSFFSRILPNSIFSYLDVEMASKLSNFLGTKSTG